MDDAEGDGFGRDVATVNVRHNGVVVICERVGTEITHMWWFALQPGDVWAMPGDDCCGYVRWECTHGLPLEGGRERLARPCGPGCSECRISLNCRFG